MESAIIKAIFAVLVIAGLVVWFLFDSFPIDEDDQ